MGQITVFEKDDCTYCNKVLARLECFRTCVLKELSAKGEEGSLDIVRVNCTTEKAFIAFLIRATGTATVPHVFFNDEYLGDSQQVLFLDHVCEKGYNILRDKLIHLAKHPSPLNSFPPSPDAVLYKVTDTLAFSSQPTEKQLGDMGVFGIETVVNILRPDSPVYMTREGELLKGQSVVFIAEPLYIATTANVLKLLDSVRYIKGPVLIHDDIGVRAALIVLLLAAEQLLVSQPELHISVKTIIGWGEDMGQNLCKFEDCIAGVLEVKNNDKK